MRLDDDGICPGAEPALGVMDAVPLGQLDAEPVGDGLHRCHPVPGVRVDADVQPQFVHVGSALAMVLPVQFELGQGEAYAGGRSLRRCR